MNEAKSEIAALQSEKSLLAKAVEDARGEFAYIADAFQASGNLWEWRGAGEREDLMDYLGRLSPRQPQAEAKCWNCGYVRGTDPQEDCMDATCLRCNAPYAKERCAEFGFKPQPPEEGR